MKFRFAALLLLAVVFMIGRAQVAKTPMYSYKIVAKYPHDPKAFTEGLVFEGKTMLEGTGQYNQSELRRVHLETGRVLSRRRLDARVFGEGVAVVGERIYQLSWTNKRGFIYDRKTLAALGEFEYNSEGWGLTSDGKDLYLSDGTSTVYVYDPKGFVLKRKFTVFSAERGPIRNLNELEWVEGELWANVWYTNQIVRIDPQSGMVKGILDLTGLKPAETVQNSDAVLNGIAYDPEKKRIFVTGKYWPALFEIQILKP